MDPRRPRISTKMKRTGREKLESSSYSLWCGFLMLATPAQPTDRKGSFGTLAL